MSFNAYQRTISNNIQQDSPETLMVRLFEGASNKIKESIERYGSGQKIKAKGCANRAMRIIDALMEYINFEEGGEIAKNLERLYDFIINQLAESVRSTNPVPSLENALKIVDNLLDTWKTLETKARQA